MMWSAVEPVGEFQAVDCHRESGPIRGRRDAPL